MEKSVLVLDCGATNVRAIAVDINGNIIAQSAVPNNTQPDPEDKSLLIWDVQEIWGKMKTAAGRVIKIAGKESIAAVTITTFGVDGATFTRNGEMTYPVISWQCARTEPVMNSIDKYIPLLVISGHIHEDYGFKQVGDTTYLNPGSLKECNAALINLEIKEVVKVDINILKL